MSERPRVLFSRCLGFEACRYDGGIIRSDFADALRDSVEVITVCPEAELGLGTPRPTLSLVRSDSGPRMIQSAGGHDLTEDMTQWSTQRLQELGELDGALLKSRSPSCAVGDAKLHAGTEGQPAVGLSAGIFTSLLQREYVELACIDEGRVTNAELRHHWLTRVFSWWRFRCAAAARSVRALMQFQARHKYLLLAQSEQSMREMGHLLAGHSGTATDELRAEYAGLLSEALAAPSTPRRHVNVLQHAFGHVSDKVGDAERRHFLEAIDRYLDGFLPLGSLQFLLGSWALRFGDEYLQQQVYLEPYPTQLSLRLDSSKDPGPRAAP